MKKFLRLLLLLNFLSVPAQAGLLLEIGGIYTGDTLSSPTSTSTTKYFYQVGALFSIQKKLWGGWSYSGMSHVNDEATDVTFSSSDTGPYFKWQIGRDKMFSLSAAYNVISRADYKNGSTTEHWEGTSFWLQAGVMPELNDGLRLGVSLNYFAANYTKKTVSGAESSASNAKTWVFPTVSLTKEW